MRVRLDCHKCCCIEVCMAAVWSCRGVVGVRLPEGCGVGKGGAVRMIGMG